MMYVLQFIDFIMFALMCIGFLSFIALLLEWSYNNENPRNNDEHVENDNETMNDAYDSLNAHGKER